MPFNQNCRKNNAGPTYFTLHILTVWDRNLFVIHSSMIFHIFVRARTFLWRCFHFSCRENKPKTFSTGNWAYLVSRWTLGQAIRLQARQTALLTLEKNAKEKYFYQEWGSEKRSFMIVSTPVQANYILNDLLRAQLPLSTSGTGTHWKYEKYTTKVSSNYFSKFNQSSEIFYGSERVLCTSEGIFDAVSYPYKTVT